MTTLNTNRDKTIAERNEPGESVGFVFIHGAGLNGGIWDRVAAELNAPCLQIDMPSRGDSFDSRKGLSLRDYIRHIKQQTEMWQVKKLIVVAHSLGGVPALEVARELSDRLAGFIAVGAAIPRSGGSFLSTMPPVKRLLMSAILRLAGTKPPESAIRQGLCNDLSEEQAAELVRSFAPESVRLYTDRADAPVPSVPKLYVKLTHDREFAPSFQDRMIANLAPQETVTLDAGHMPMLSRPRELCNILETFLSSRLNVNRL